MLFTDDDKKMIWMAVYSNVAAECREQQMNFATEQANRAVANLSVTQALSPKKDVDPDESQYTGPTVTFNDNVVELAVGEKTLNHLSIKTQSGLSAKTSFDQLTEDLRSGSFKIDNLVEEIISLVKESNGRSVLVSDIVSKLRGNHGGLDKVRTAIGELLVTSGYFNLVDSRLEFRK